MNVGNSFLKNVYWININNKKMFVGLSYTKKKLSKKQLYKNNNDNIIINRDLLITY